MDLAARLEQLEELVREAKSMPLSSSVLVNRDEVLAMIAEMRETLPEEIKQARWIVRDREDLLAKARGEGERIVDQAQEDQLRMARKEEIVARATKEADRIVSEAEDVARTMRSEAEDYVDAKLAQFEISIRKIIEASQASTTSLSRTLDQVEGGRQRLRGPATAAEAEFAQPPVHEAALFDEEEEQR
jgi:cell division septum initiation protein DivIVA